VGLLDHPTHRRSVGTSPVPARFSSPKAHTSSLESLTHTWTPEPKRVRRVPLCRQHGQAHPPPNVSQNCVNSSSFCGIQSSYLSIRSPRTLPSYEPRRPTQNVCPHGLAVMASCPSTIPPNVSQNCVNSSSFCGIQSSYLSVRSPHTLPSCVPGRPTPNACVHGATHPSSLEPLEVDVLRAHARSTVLMETRF
jgi:hypothetical protein